MNYNSYFIKLLHDFIFVWEFMDLLEGLELTMIILYLVNLRVSENLFEGSIN
jgi:hypothetical protein